MIVLPEDLEMVRDVREMGPFAGEYGHDVIYFMQAEGIPLVKIGKTRASKIGQRLAELQTGSPAKLTVLLAIDCGSWGDYLAIELRLHEQFKECRSHGEWFRMEGDLLDYLKAAGARV